MAIPKDEVVAFVLRDVLKKKPAFSQAELGKRLGKVLVASDTSYAITGKRAREVAVRTPGIKICIENRDGPKPSRCPCCGGRLKKVMNMNLAGKNTLIGLSCIRCPYRGRNNRWIPARYEFRI
jgi:hypothetical protein